jgi:hypothetical protein
VVLAQADLGYQATLSRSIDKINIWFSPYQSDMKLPGI